MALSGESHAGPLGRHLSSLVGSQWSWGLKQRQSLAIRSQPRAPILTSILWCQEGLGAGEATACTLTHTSTQGKGKQGLPASYTGGGGEGVWGHVTGPHHVPVLTQGPTESRCQIYVC